MPRNFKPMPNVDAGACEIRAKVGTQWRMIYVANKGDAVSAYVLRAPRKSVKRQRKGHEDIDPAASRYQSIREQGMNQTGTLIRRKQRQCLPGHGLAARRSGRASLARRSDGPPAPLLVETGGWAQQQAARRFGIAQSRVSDLVRGKGGEFSVDMLITLAARAGLTLELSLA